MQKNTDRPMWRKKSDLLGGAVLQRETFCCDTVSETEIPFGTLCTHEILTIDLIVEGNGVLQVFGQPIPCKKGDIYIIPPDIPHGYYKLDEKDRLCISRLLFDMRDWFSGEIASFGDPRFCYGAFRDRSIVAYAMLHASKFSEVRTLLDVIGAEAREQGHEWRDAVRAHLSVLLITLGRYIGDAVQTIRAETPTEWSFAALAIRVLMERFGDADLTLESVAEFLYISRAHLSRLFKQFAGQSFSEYLRNVRLDNACKLLRETKLTVEEIVACCGLRDLPSFYQNFQKHTGITPNQYRANKAEALKIISNEEKKMVILSDISEKLQQGRGKLVVELVKQAIEEGCAPAEILNQGLLAGMNVIGEKFKNNEVFVPEVLIAARAMNMGTQILKPYLAESGVMATGRVCVGTVQGDLHDIGKNLVCMMLESKGLEVIDLGTDVSADVFVKTAIEKNCQVICCSALLTTTMHVMDEVVKEAEKAGIRDKVKIMVGGAPVNQAFCDQIGADCYTADAASAADAAVAFCKA